MTCGQRYVWMRAIATIQHCVPNLSAFGRSEKIVIQKPERNSPLSALKWKCHSSVANSTLNDDKDASVALDDACMDSWQAYSAMYESKQQHYEFLQLLEDKKKKFNLSPSESDQQKLAQMLEQHDIRVKQFIAISAQLKTEHPDSHSLLFKFIGQLGDGEPTKKVQH